MDGMIEVCVTNITPFKGEFSIMMGSCKTDELKVKHTVRALF